MLYASKLLQLTFEVSAQNRLELAHNVGYPKKYPKRIYTNHIFEFTVSTLPGNSSGTLGSVSYRDI